VLQALRTSEGRKSSMSPSTAPPSTTQRLLRHCLLNTSPARLLKQYILVLCFTTVSKECVKLSSIQLSNLHSRYATLACRSAAPLVLPAAARARAVGQQETARSRTAQERWPATQSQVRESSPLKRGKFRICNIVISILSRLTSV
jgi:hypothetical protein